MRRLIAAVSLVAVALLPACNRDTPPSSLFSAGGYHVRGEKVYYLRSFPGDAFEIDGADPASFHAFDQTYARDKSTVYVDGRALPGADASTFELLDGDLSKDSAAVYWSDGEVLSEDPAHFAIISSADHYLFTKDATTVHLNGNPIAGADPATFEALQDPYARDGVRVHYFADPPSFRVLNADFECSADARRAYYRNSVVAGVDPITFPSNRSVTRCDETSISFAE